MKIISYNINGIRDPKTNTKDNVRPSKRELLEWMAGSSADIICFQEVKASESLIDWQDFNRVNTGGYKFEWCSNNIKTHEHGVATFSKMKSNLVERCCGISEYDDKGRVLRTDFGDLTVLNCYFPAITKDKLLRGKNNSLREKFSSYVNRLRQDRPNLIVVGDYNIAYSEKDLHTPKNQRGFLPEERAWMTEWFNSGFIDSFRYMHPFQSKYSRWHNVEFRKADKGWRIDYITVTANLKNRIIDADHDYEARHSDHCPVWFEINL